MYGGAVLATPTVVPILFSGDPLRPQIEEFLTSLAGSDYWKATTKEYGVGALTVAPTVVVGEAPPKAIEDTEIVAWLAQHLDGTQPGLVTFDANSVYVVLYPTGVEVTAAGHVACVDFGGYHSEGLLGTASGAATSGGPGTSFAYVAIPECAEWLGFEGIDVVTEELSHELVEAVTDPFTITSPAYASFVAGDLAWAMAAAPSGAVDIPSEVADVCMIAEGSASVFTRAAGGSVVQRTWSNQQAVTGQDPCVPAAGVYFNAEPALTDEVTLHVSATESYPTRGIQVPLHESRTVDVRLFSTGTRPDWYVAASDVAADEGGAPSLRFQWDRQKGNDGDVLRLTIERVADGPSGGTPIRIYSSDAPGDTAVSHAWPAYVGN
jgi:hypothetical protein